MRQFFTLVVFNMLCFGALAQDHMSKVSTVLTKSEDAKWQVLYTTDKPVKRLGFVRNPGDQRVKRWSSQDKNLELVYQDGNEFIQTKDGSTFNRAVFELTPVYTPLPKDYAPFSPYSDGGILVHSGRFFACVDACQDETNGWSVTVVIPKADHMVVSGKIYRERHQWIDKDNGQNVYVGQQKPLETEHFLSIVDSALPQVMKDKLDRDMPKLMEYFAKKLGAIHNGQKAALYVSYANKPGTSHQGGTFDNQVFMHYDLNNLEEMAGKKHFIDETTWGLAHESAHFYQEGEAALVLEHNQSWLHEGSADWFAALASLAQDPKSKDYVNKRIQQAEKVCANGLKEMRLLDAAEKGRFDLYYKCGMLIHRAIDNLLRDKTAGKQNIFTHWRTYRAMVEQGESAGPDLFLQLVGDTVSRALADQIHLLISEKHDDPKPLIEQLNIRLM